MPNYLLAYHGGGMPETDEARARVMDAWGVWYQKLGGAVVDADGSGLRVLTRSRGNEEEAYPNAWSPDGRRLLFVRGYAPAALDQVWSTAPDGSDARALTRAYPAGGENASPVWFRGKLTSVRSPPPRVRTIGRALRTRSEADADVRQAPCRSDLGAAAASALTPRRR